MYVHIHFLFRMTDIVTSQNIDLSSWGTLYIIILIIIIIIIIIIIMALQPVVGSWPLFQFLDPIHSR
jgi:hypothetical protein